jgi:protein-S-isoprenylcysteine O-methyltransferase Ste14
MLVSILLKPSHLMFRPFFAFLALPGIFAGAVPAWIADNDYQHFPPTTAGYILILLGLLLLLWCVRDFWTIGHGTLAPWDPPKTLVILGFYKYVRNPMYVAITILLTGWILVTGSRDLAIYTAILLLAFHLRVLFYEEPRLRRQFPVDWQTYSTKVNRWLPKIHF